MRTILPISWLMLGFLLPLSVCGQEMKATWNPDEKYFGTDAFVPDWRAAEEIDDKASEHFLANYWPKFKGDYERGGTGTVANAEAAGAMVFLVPYTKSVLPDDLPATGRSDFKTAALFAAQGQSEPLAVGVRTLGAAAEISVAASDLKCGSATLSSRDIGIRLNLSYMANEYVGGGKYRPAFRPMVLLKPPKGVWTFPPNWSMSYLLDVHVPRDQAPGLYKGTVTVKAGGKLVREFGLEIEVLPFKLKTNNFHAGAYGTTCGLWAGGFTGYYPEMIEMDARWGYNLAGAFFNKGQEIPFKKTADGGLEVDPDHPKFKVFNETMALLTRHGMGKGQVAFWCWGSSGSVAQFNNVLAAAGYPAIQTAEGKQGFALVCKAIKEAEKKYGWPEFVINPFDEALKNKAAAADVAAAMPLVQQLSPETRIYMTEWREGYTRTYQTFGAADGQPRLNFHVMGANTLSEAGRALQDSLGGEFWVYMMLQNVDPQGRFAQGFGPYIVRAETSLIWANYFAGAPLYGLDGSGGWTLHYLMPLNPGDKSSTRGPVIASCRSPLARAGIDDRKYIETLKYYARKNKSADDLKYLDGLPARCRALAGDLKNIGGIDNVDAKVVNADGFQKIRIELRDRILKLVTK